MNPSFNVENGRNKLCSIDARAKLILLIFFALVVVSTPTASWIVFIMYTLILFSVYFISGLKIATLLSRLMTILPFVIMTFIFVPFFDISDGSSGFLSLGGVRVYRSALFIALSSGIKAFLSAAAMILFVSTTSFMDFAGSLIWLRLPKVFVLIICFAYRYIFTIIEEIIRMKRACESRLYDGKWIWRAGTIGSMIGSLFLRSYERGERVYMAMLSRGFDGSIDTGDTPPLDMRLLPRLLVGMGLLYFVRSFA